MRTLNRPTGRSTTTAIALSVALLAGLVPVSQSAATVAAPPGLVAVSLSQGTVSVDGLAIASVTVSVHLTDDTGVVPSGMDGHVPTPHIVLTRADGGYHELSLTLTSGSPMDGTWTADLLVPSTWNGVWRVSRVRARSEGGELDIDPESIGMTRTLTVIGTHLPKLGMWFRPHPAPLGSEIALRGRLTYSDTGAPIPRQALLIGFQERCADDLRGGFRVRTDANGYYELQRPEVTQRLLACVYLIRPLPPAPQATFNPFEVAVIASRAGRPVVQAIVTARAIRSSVPLGGEVRIAGTVRPRMWAKIYLQRLTQRGWRTESVGQIRFDRFSVWAKPPYRGVHRYRVYRPSIRGFIAGDRSAVMVIRAT